MSLVTLSMRYKKQANNGLGFKKDLDESLRTLKAYGYILTPNQESYISAQNGCKVAISDPVKKRRASGTISKLVPTQLSNSGKQRYTIEFSDLREVTFVLEDFSAHRKGVKVHDKNGLEVK
ncbi:hypothetical protein [Vibrio navarrensis]|nr:hypothetical protein [Vibrio navarrensis]MBE4609645.1 hypothetical protein [Vibrio navarrensis]MBE4617068.1 hypothetical protein [Vibrio navarrensis]QOD68626.1 hypothetical protein IF132_06765 [Vibrio navarrensis]QOD68774.1 hypothetical protein IF132_07835 [Vibrio navarrensis]